MTSRTLRLFAAFALAMCVAGIGADAKVKNRMFVGCVEARNGKFDLVTTSAKGKARNYALLGSHDFAKDVGHRVRVSGTLSKRVMTVDSVVTIASNCRL